MLPTLKPSRKLAIHFSRDSGQKLIGHCQRFPPLPITDYPLPITHYPLLIGISIQNFVPCPGFDEH